MHILVFHVGERKRTFDNQIIKNGKKHSTHKGAMLFLLREHPMSKQVHAINCRNHENLI
jgi:hypothetical protein